MTSTNLSRHLFWHNRLPPISEVKANAIADYRKRHVPTQPVESISPVSFMSAVHINQDVME